jgi:uncharacterized membrane protein YfcA
MLRPSPLWLVQVLLVLALLLALLVDSATSQSLPQNRSCLSPLQCGEPFICLENATCGVCANNSDCDQKGKLKICLDNRCRHKGLVPLAFWDGLVVLPLFVGGVMAAGAGVGGGGIYVPLLILLNGFTARDSVPLSTCMIVGASCASVSILLTKRHPAYPAVNRPLIYFDFALFVLPPNIAGTTIGLLFWSMSPNWSILAVLVVVLSTSGYLSFKKGMQLWKSEYSALAADNSPSNAPPPAPSQPIVATPVPAIEPNSAPATTAVASTEDDCSSSSSEEEKPTSLLAMEIGPSDELQALLEQESRVPWGKMLYLAATVALFTVIFVMRGPNTAPSVVGVQPCSAAWWGLTWMAFPLLILSSVASVFWVLRFQRRKRAAGGPSKPIKGDFDWTVRNCVVTALVAIATGVISAYVGIGGGAVLGPLMLMYGFYSDVSAATSNFMIVGASSASLAQYIAAGRLPWDYGVLMFLLGLVSAAVGQIALGYLVTKYKRKSLIIFAMVIVIIASAIMLTATGVVGIVDGVRYSYGLGFRTPCDNSV